MMKRILYIVCLLLAFDAQSQELRVAGGFDYKLNKQQSLDFSTEWRNLFEAKQENYLYFRADYTYKFNKKISLKVSNRYAFECEDVDNSRFRTTLDFIYKPKQTFHAFKLSNRIRMQQQVFDFDRADYILRERLKFTYKINKRVESYTSVELLYTINRDAYAYNFSLGSSFEIGEVELDLYYKSEIESGYKTVLFNHVIGVAWDF